MEISVIIFIIWIIISIIGGVMEGDKKKKKANSNKKKPTNVPNNNRTETNKKSIEEQTQVLLQKYETYKNKSDNSTTHRMSDRYKKLAEQAEKQLKQYDVDSKKVNKRVNNEEIQNHSEIHENKYLEEHKEQIRQSKPKRQKETIKNLMDYNEQEKKDLVNLQAEYISEIEKEAKEIINNVQLSERTRQAMVKQLYLKNKYKLSDETVNVDEDNVVNGIIWSEILARPKELK